MSPHLKTTWSWINCHQSSATSFSGVPDPFIFLSQECVSLSFKFGTNFFSFLARLTFWLHLRFYRVPFHSPKGIIHTIADQLTAPSGWSVRWGVRIETALTCLLPALAVLKKYKSLNGETFSILFQMGQVEPPGTSDLSWAEANKPSPNLAGCCK